ncbi:MAG TPA: hypothetical protein ENN51_08010 [candidate division WOR-3 bacterium]|uniref:Tetratricopeptide repeat protein n=1 Tax=candidate division WOR-3 bacterium TaxID=2052148 RepID=A0A7V0XFJ6_UNCW3|nr:hypothetical protein [candidate division WOR-3 bacterium]
MRDQMGFREQMVRAQQMARFGQDDKALAIAESLARARPDQPEPGEFIKALEADRTRYLLLAEARELAGKREYTRAVELLDSLAATGYHDAGPEVVRVLLGEGHWHWSQGRAGQAKRSFEVAQERDPGNAQARKALDDIGKTPRPVTATTGQRPTPATRPAPDPRANTTPAAKPVSPTGTQAPPPPLDPALEQRALDAYAKGYEELKDRDDTTTARNKFREVVEMLREYPENKWYKRASDLLREIGR